MGLPRNCLELAPAASGGARPTSQDTVTSLSTTRARLSAGGRALSGGAPRPVEAAGSAASVRSGVDLAYGC